MKKPLLLCIMDGCGIKELYEGNAFERSHKPFFNRLLEEYPSCRVDASGEAVGLPEGQMGNSEVGHMNIGAGRIVYQPLALINKEIKDGNFFKNEKLLNVMNHVKDNNSKLHIVGLISDGGVHSHIDHLMALLDMAKQENITKLYLHLFTDGRDVSPTSAYSYISRVEDKLKEIGVGKIASVSGRYYGMDRDNNYDRLIKSYDVIVNNKGDKLDSIEKYIEDSYKNDITDEFLIPAKFADNGNIEENDGVIAFNFRRDRLREMFTALTNPEFNDMPVVRFNNLSVITMMPVVESVKAPSAYDDPNLKNILGEYIAEKGLSQLRTAETEKYAHVTFFFDGGKEVEYPNEKKILIPSPKVATYDLKPEMSCNEVTDSLLPELENMDVVILNFANGDMLGHTGVIPAAIEGVEVMDKNLEKIWNRISELGGKMIVTADHGNCEEMLTEDGEPMTSHTTNLVRLIVTDKNLKLHDGKLCDIAPTMLDLLGLEKPVEMTGVSLIDK